MVILCAFALVQPVAGRSLADGGDPTAAFAIQPRIFNGIVTFDYPFAGVLLHRDRPGDAWQSRCTLTLVGPATVLTAAHCVCRSYGGLCQPGGRDEPVTADYRILLQNGGLSEIASISVPVAFDFPERDFAVLDLAEPVVGIAAAALAEGLPPFGTAAEIVGFGSISSGIEATGIKRVGTVHTTSCDGRLDDDLFVCWETDIGTEDANTCLGDSGAPLLVATAEGAPEVAAITSGGYNSCDRDDLSFDTAIGPHLEAITAMSEGNLSTATLGEVVVRATRANGRFDASVFSETLTMDVADGMSRLVVAGNADDDGGNRYSLSVRRGAQPTDAQYDCRFELPGVFQACTLLAPGAGTWYATYRRDAGAGGEYQLSATTFGPVCSLDVDGSGLFDALTDGVLLLRYLFGFRGETLTDQAIGNLAWRASPEQIVEFLDSAPCLADLDVDGNGVREALTDGLLAIRYLFGFSGDALVDNAVGAGATRTTPAVISDWLQRLER